MKLENTTNYSLFQMNEEQRDMKHPKIKMIAGSMQKHGFRPSKPLQCYKKGRKLIIVDGHHRFLAAKSLGIPVFYVVEGDDAQETMAIVNQLVQKWGVIDFVRLYAKRGNPHYENLLEYHEKGIPILMAASLATGEMADSMNRGRKISEGRFEITTTDSLDKIISVMDEFKDRSPACASRSFIAALSKCLLFDGFDYDLFVRRMRENSGMIEKTSNMDQMMKQIESVYNYRSRKPIPLQFMVEENSKKRKSNFGR